MQKPTYSCFWLRTIGCTKLLLAMFFLFCITFSYGQVWTTVLTADNRLEDVIPYHSTKPVTNVKLMPAVDIAAVLRQDSIEGRIPLRYGVKIPTAITKNDGEVEEKGNLIIWKTSVRSKGAISLNFHLSNLTLPEGSALYIYNKTGTMFSGPVDKSHIFEGIYATDALNGEEVILEVIIPKESFPEFDLRINMVVHGFRKEVIGLREFGDSGSCNVDVNCPAGSGWGNERDAVAMILNSDGELCSGALINNGCQDLRSFFLTANHCLAGENVANWIFRFNYDSPNPTTPNCRGSEPTSWLTYSGATLRANRAASDFALLELNWSVIGQPTLALAGWNRGTGTPALPVTCIHHPAGDVKKISINSSTAVISSTSPYIEWFVDKWNVGSTIGGSSGSPLFDSNHRIIGQDYRGDGEPECDIDKGTYFGKFDASWTGGGTNATRLSNWLGGGSNPTTTNTIRSPYITVNSSGPVCNSSTKTFTLNNLISGRTASWSATPSSLFVTSSGSGTSAVVQAKAGASGLGTITFTISAAANCNPIIVTRHMGRDTIFYDDGLQLFVHQPTRKCSPEWK